MARIASTTSAGVPVDPTGGMTLDALMARQKALAEARSQTAAPRNIQSPWQGLAQMAQAFVGARQESAAADQLTAGREQLAKIRAGINLDTGPTSEQISQASLLDPDYADNLTRLAADAVRAKRQREQQLADRAEGRTYEEGQTAATRVYEAGQESAIDTREQGQTVAAEGRAQRDQIADEARAKADRIEQEKRAALEPGTNLGKLKRDFDNKLIDEGTYKAAVAKEVATAKSMGMELEFDEEGRVTGFRQGEGVGQGGPDVKQEGKNLANAKEDYRTAAQSANNLLPTISNMEKAFKNAGYTGPGGDWVGWLDDAVEATTGLNIPGSGTSGARAIVRGGGLGFIMDAVAKSKGSISDKETALFQAASPGMATTQEGAKMMLGIAKVVAQRAIERDARAQQWVQDNGSLVGFEQSWAHYLDANPVIVADEAGGIRLASEAPPAVANPTNPAATAPSEEDIAETMRANNMTRQQVLDALAKGGGNGGP